MTQARLDKESDNLRQSQTNSAKLKHIHTDSHKSEKTHTESHRIHGLIQTRSDSKKCRDLNKLKQTQQIQANSDRFRQTRAEPSKLIKTYILKQNETDSGKFRHINRNSNKSRQTQRKKPRQTQT